MKIIYLALALSAPAFAGESGYLQNGETHVVYQDGKKVGEWPTHFAHARKVSGLDKTPSNDVIVHYDDDGATRCYWTQVDNSGSPDQRAVGLSCLKK